MINKFFDQLKTHVESKIDWLQRVGRNVTFLEGEKGSVVPVQCFDEDCDEPQTYLLPQKSVDSLMFFELKGIIKEVDDACLQSFRVSFTAFTWYNCNKIEVKINNNEIKCCEKFDFLHEDVIETIKEFKNSQYKASEFNVSRPYISKNLNYHPYSNFLINFEAIITFNPCENNEEPLIEIKRKEC